MKDNETPSLIIPGPHASVILALKTARRLGAHGNIVEVWRGHERVHHEMIGNPDVQPTP